MMFMSGVVTTAVQHMSHSMGALAPQSPYFELARRGEIEDANEGGGSRKYRDFTSGSFNGASTAKGNKPVGVMEPRFASQDRARVNFECRSHRQFKKNVMNDIEETISEIQWKYLHSNYPGDKAQMCQTLNNLLDREQQANALQPRDWEEMFKCSKEGRIQDLSHELQEFLTKSDAEHADDAADDEDETNTTQLKSSIICAALLGTFMLAAGRVTKPEEYGPSNRGDISPAFKPGRNFEGLPSGIPTNRPLWAQSPEARPLPSPPSLESRREQATLVVNREIALLERRIAEEKRSQK